MYLFQLIIIYCEPYITVIYIPLCIYFNKESSLACLIICWIYIPLCIYFNCCLHPYLFFAVLFTFHYVSISTIIPLNSVVLSVNLHSTMYLFQRRPFWTSSRSGANLHSTMYLFQRPGNACIHELHSHLHSTMYLFQQRRVTD